QLESRFRFPLRRGDGELHLQPEDDRPRDRNLRVGFYRRYGSHCPHGDVSNQVRGPMRAMTRWLMTELAVLAFAAAPARAQEEKETPRGPGDGIKFHGHWTIDVKNPDGSLASHHEFENALIGSGALALSLVLAHDSTIQNSQLQ